MDLDRYEQLRQEWTDQFVEADQSRPELQRFAGKVGRVVTVNWNQLCLVDFADGAWYDISPTILRKVTDEEQTKKYDRTANSNQPLPIRQA